MPNSSLSESIAKSVHDFELELDNVEDAINIVCTTSDTDGDYHQYLEALHSQMLNAREKYADLRSELVAATIL